MGKPNTRALERQARDVAALMRMFANEYRHAAAASRRLRPTASEPMTGTANSEAMRMCVCPTAAGATLSRHDRPAKKMTFKKPI